MTRPSTFHLVCLACLASVSLVCLSPVLLAQPQPQSQPRSQPVASPQIETRSLRQVLILEKVIATGLPPQVLDQRMVLYAAEHTPQAFTIAYYIESGAAAASGTSKAGRAASPAAATSAPRDDLHVRTFDKTHQAWRHATFTRNRTNRPLGSLESLRHVGGLILVDMHLNPSAGSVLVLTPRLEVVTTLYGWIVATLDDGSVLYHRSQVHFAPTHAFELGYFDAKTRRARIVYPRQPYQPLRAAYVDSVRKSYTALSARDPEWQARRNHHGDPARFDSRLNGSISLLPGTHRFAMLVTFGDDQADPPTPREQAVVTCDLALLPADACRETRKADWQSKHPGAPDDALLKAILSQQ